MKEETESPKFNKAEDFKKRNGYSLTTKKLMEKNGCETLEEYKAIRKEKVKTLKEANRKAVPAPKAKAQPVTPQKKKK